jgi:hypothetical protein
MTKSISSFPKNQRLEVALHRIQEKKGGLGFFAAVDYFKAVDKKVLEESRAKNAIAEMQAEIQYIETP